MCDAEEHALDLTGSADGDDDDDERCIHTHVEIRACRIGLLPRTKTTKTSSFTRGNEKQLRYGLYRPDNDLIIGTFTIDMYDVGNKRSIDHAAASRSHINHNILPELVGCGELAAVMPILRKISDLWIP